MTMITLIHTLPLIKEWKGVRSMKPVEWFQDFEEKPRKFVWFTPKDTTPWWSVWADCGGVDMALIFVDVDESELMIHIGDIENESYELVPFSIETWHRLCHKHHLGELGVVLERSVKASEVIQVSRISYTEAKLAEASLVSMGYDVLEEDDTSIESMVIDAIGRDIEDATVLSYSLVWELIVNKHLVPKEYGGRDALDDIEFVLNNLL